MKRDATRCLFGLMICAALTGVVRAQSESSGSARVSDQPGPLPEAAAPVYSEPGYASGVPGGWFQATPIDYLFEPRFFADARAGVLYGYEESYTNIGGFLPYFFEENALLFADARGMVSYEGRGGANVGVGWRYYEQALDRIFGLSAWYDVNGNRRIYNQVGVSLESLGRYFDFRANGYIPVGQDFNLLSTQLVENDQFPSQFVGNQILLTRINEIESAFTGFDMEVGGPMPFLGRYGLNGYTGFYFFTSSSAQSDFTGVSGRLTWQTSEYTSIGVQVTDDHTFGTNTQLQVNMSLPNGKPARWAKPLSVRERLTQQVVRNYRVTVERELQAEQEAAINPKDDLPYFIVHVDPNRTDGTVDVGTGTIDNPYSALSQFDNLGLVDKSQVDIIYVAPRVDLATLQTDSRTTNLDQGVTLLMGQRLLSTIVPHTLTAAQTGGLVEYRLPGYDPPLAINNEQFLLPQLTNRNGGNVVTLADGAICLEVAGFNIQGSATGSGIVGTNNQNVLINRNVIETSANGVVLTNLTGVTADNRESIIEKNIIRYNLADGLRVDNSGGTPLDLYIRNNPDFSLATPLTNNFIVDVEGTINGVPGPSQQFPESLDGDGPLFLTEPVRDTNGNVVTFDDGSVVQQILRDDAGNPVLNDAPPSIDPITNELSPPGAARDDGILANRDDGIDIRANNGSVINLQLAANRILNNQDNGVELSATAGSTIRGLPRPLDVNDATVPPGAIVDNVIGSRPLVLNEQGFNGLNGISISASASTIDFFNQQVVIVEEIVNGVVVPKVTTAPAFIRDNIIAGNTGNGIFVDSTNGSDVSLALYGNSIGRSELPNSRLFADSSDTTGTPTILSGNVNSGFTFNSDSGNALLAIGAQDTVLVPDDLTTPNIDETVTIANNNTFDNNSLNGIVINAGGSTVLGYSIENNLITRDFRQPVRGTNARLSFLYVGDDTEIDFASDLDPDPLFIFTNESDIGIDVESITWDLGPSNLEFNTVYAGDAGKAAIQPKPAPGRSDYSDVETEADLLSVNGVVINQGTDPLTRADTGALVDENVIPDGDEIVTFVFNPTDPLVAGSGFNAPTITGGTNGDQFAYQVQLGDLIGPDGGLDLTGATIAATFRDSVTGNTITGSAVILPDATSTAANPIMVANLIVPGIDPVNGSGDGNRGIHVTASGTSIVNAAVIRDNDVRGYATSGVEVHATGLSRMSNLIVDNNRISENGLVPLSTDPNVLGSGAGLTLRRSGAAEFNATVSNNVIGALDNLGTVDDRLGNWNNGIEIYTTGSAINPVNITLTNNSVTQNSEDGLYLLAAGNSNVTLFSTGDDISLNGDDNIQLVLNDSARLTTNLTSITADQAGGDGLNVEINGTSVYTMNLTATAALTSNFSNNTGSGIVISSNENGQALINIDGLTFSDNGVDGLRFNRGDASLMQVFVQNVTLSDNGDDGLQFDAAGSPPEDPNQPLSGLPSLLVLRNVTADNNGLDLEADAGGNGLEANTSGDATVQFDVRNSSFTNNADSGILLFSSSASSIGVSTTDRAYFQDLIITDNNDDGIKLFAMGLFATSPSQFIEVTSSQDGLTLIQDNGDDGIAASMPLGTIDLLVTGNAGSNGQYTTRIERNGAVTGFEGHGIEFVVADAAIGDVDSVTDAATPDARFVNLDNSDQELVEDRFPNGYEFNILEDFVATGTLTIQTVTLGDSNVFDVNNLGNAGSGVQVLNSNGDNFRERHNNTFGSDLPGDNIAAINTRGRAGLANISIDNSNISGNAGDGIGLYSNGDNQFGVALEFVPANGPPPFFLPVPPSGTGFFNNGSSLGAGNILNAVITNNVVSDNGTTDRAVPTVDIDGQLDRPRFSAGPNPTVQNVVVNTAVGSGINIDIEGHHGDWFVDVVNGLPVYQRTAGNSIILDGNTIDRNAEFGVRFVQNAGLRPDYVLFFQDNFLPAAPTPPNVYQPLQLTNTPYYNFDNGNSGIPFFLNFSLLTNYMDLRTDTITSLTMINNLVRFNGTPANGETSERSSGGMFVRVSTNSYLSADIGGAFGSGNGNTFTGNENADIRFESFVAYDQTDETQDPIQPPESNSNTAPVFDDIVLDKTAQMDLRFNNNVGREVDANALMFIGQADSGAAGRRTAMYDNEDSEKGSNGDVGSRRFAQLFQIDDGFNLNLTNTFTTDLVDQFSFDGLYKLRLLTDPSFPNIAFPENGFIDPGDVWLP